MDDEFSNAAPRPLPWPLRDQVAMDANTGPDEWDDNPFVWPDDPDERTLIVFNLSQREYTAIASAIDVGSDIAFGADAIKVWWLFVRNMRYNVSLCDAIAQAILTCEDVQAALATAIATEGAVRDAITGVVREHVSNGTEYPIEIEIPSGAASGNILPENPDCDPDILWSQCVGIVQTANRMTTDFLETWETYTNAVETIPAIVGAIPFLGEVADIAGLDAISAYANSIIDSIAENYAADYTLEYEQELACEIFCAAKSSCAVSIDLLCNIINARLSGQLNLSNGVELMLSLIDADISGINVADLYLAAFFNMLKVANLVLPITWGIEAYLVTIAAFNDPSDDWILLCEDCPGCAGTWTSVSWFDGTGSSGGTNLYNVAAELTDTPQNYVIRNVEYGDWDNGEYLLTSIEMLSSGDVEGIYLESNDGVIYAGTDFEDANSMLPACVRFIQVYRPPEDGPFSVQFGIELS